MPLMSPWLIPAPMGQTNRNCSHQVIRTAGVDPGIRTGDLRRRGLQCPFPESVYIYKLRERFSGGGGGGGGLPLKAGKPVGTLACSNHLSLIQLVPHFLATVHGYHRYLKLRPSQACKSLLGEAPSSLCTTTTPPLFAQQPAGLWMLQKINGTWVIWGTLARLIESFVS